MTPGERFKRWIDGLAEAWGDRLGSWLSRVMDVGARKFLEATEQDTSPTIAPMLEILKQIPGLPEEQKRMIEKAQGRTSFAWGVVALVLGVVMMVASAVGAVMPWSRKGSYLMEKLAQSFRLDPGTITAIWLRNKEAYDQLWQDLKDQGWDEDRIAVAKELANIIPPLADMVRFADFGSFDPEVIKKWREFYDAPDWIKVPMALLGITGEWANKYWFSHWRQPGRYELGELHRRGQIDDELVKMAYLTQGFSSFWQGKLLELVKEPWTRVDVRRMWDMRTISPEQLEKAYHKLGYYGEELKGMVLWTKVYVAFPDLIARWKNGWITLDEVRAELTGLGMPAARVEEMIETKMEKVKPERVTKERELTKAEIVKGVKKEVISWKQGIELLVDMGYDKDEADFILTINIAAEAGSPDTFEEFKELTQKYKIAVGREAKPMTEEIKAAAAEVIRLTEEVESLNQAVAAEEKGLIPEEPLPEAVTAKLKKLRVALHRGEAALAKAKTDYDALVAAWRHKAS